MQCSIVNLTAQVKGWGGWVGGGGVGGQKSAGSAFRAAAKGGLDLKLHSNTFQPSRHFAFRRTVLHYNLDQHSLMLHSFTFQLYSALRFALVLPCISGQSTVFLLWGGFNLNLPTALCLFPLRSHKIYCISFQPQMEHLCMQAQSAGAVYPNDAGTNISQVVLGQNKAT